jgi:hypothetical protein
VPVVFTPSQMLSGWANLGESNRRGTSRALGTKEMGIGFWLANLKEGDHFKETGIHESVISTLILYRMRRYKNGIVWLKTRTTGVELQDIRSWSFVKWEEFLKYLSNYMELVLLLIAVFMFLFAGDLPRMSWFSGSFCWPCTVGNLKFLHSSVILKRPLPPASIQINFSETAVLNSHYVHSNPHVPTHNVIQYDLTVKLVNNYPLSVTPILHRNEGCTYYTVIPGVQPTEFSSGCRKVVKL